MAQRKWNRFKLFLCLFLTLVIVGGWAGISFSEGLNPYIAGQAVASGGTSYADINLYWGCNSTTADKSAGDSSVTLQASATIDSSFSYAGATGSSLDCDAAYRRAELDISSSDIIDPISGRVGFYVYFDTDDDAILFDAYYDGDNSIRFYPIGGSYALRHEAGGTIVYVSSGWTPSLTTWYFVEIAWGGPTYTLQIWVDGVSQETSTDSLGTFGTTPNILKIGNTSGSASDLHIDQFFSSDDPTRDLYSIRTLTSVPD